MLGTFCACLFGLAAMAASLSIWLTVTNYAPDVARLRRTRRSGLRELHVSWRILAPAADSRREPAFKAERRAPLDFGRVECPLAA